MKAGDLKKISDVNFKKKLEIKSLKIRNQIIWIMYPDIIQKFIKWVLHEFMKGNVNWNLNTSCSVSEKNQSFLV